MTSLVDRIATVRTRYAQSPTYATAVSTLGLKLYSALADVEMGRPIILVDSMDRENEGDLMIAAEKATVANIAFMARYGRGIMCLPTTGAILDRLHIPMMIPPVLATDPYQTAFTVSVDARQGVTTGVCAADRVQTIRTLLDPASRPIDLARPGHLFPLRARDGLLADRQGHTESSVVLTQLVGFQPMAVIAEIMNDDGTMARMPDLERLASEHNLRILAIPEIMEALGL